MMLTQVHSLPSSLTYSPRGVIRASRDHIRVETLRSKVSSTGLCSCGRKHFLEAASPTSPFLPIYSSNVSRSKDMSQTFYPERPDWYKDLFAWFLSKAAGIRAYEEEIADYKRKLFENLMTAKAENVLEIGIGTGPNMKYYAGNENVCVFGMDPNHEMEKYACESAREAGLKPANFKFMQGVGEAIPLDDASVDAVVATLVLCSVSDVTQTLNEIKRVLKPGGFFLFIEHVAAKDGSFFRHVQNLLDPYQQVVAGCHLTRDTDLYISAAGFDGGTKINTAEIHSFQWMIRPHVYGIAYK